jgi:hypothetical protein
VDVPVTLLAHWHHPPIGADLSNAAVCTAIDALIALGETEAAPAENRSACSKGCNYCCHMRVVVTAPEAMRIVAYVEETFLVEERAAFARRVVATDDRARRMSDEAWGEARLPCPLLVGSECVRSIAAPTIPARLLPAKRTGMSRSMPVLQERSGRAATGSSRKRTAVFASRAHCRHCAFCSRIPSPLPAGAPARTSLPQPSSTPTIRKGILSGCEPAGTRPPAIGPGHRRK